MPSNTNAFRSLRPILRKSYGAFSRLDLLSSEDALQPCLVTDVFSCFPQWLFHAKDTASWLCEAVAEESGGCVFAECSANDGLAGIAEPRYYGEQVTPNDDEGQGSRQDSPASVSLHVGAPQSLQHQRDAQASPSNLREPPNESPRDGGENRQSPSLGGQERTPGAVSSPNAKKTKRVYANQGVALSSPVGGIEILDDAGLLCRSLLSLKVAAIQTRKAQQRQKRQQQQQRQQKQQQFHERRSASSHDYLSPTRATAQTALPSGRSVSLDDVSVDSFCSENALNGSMLLSSGANRQSGDRVIGGASSVDLRRHRRPPPLTLQEARQILLERRDSAEAVHSPSTRCAFFAASLTAAPEEEAAAGLRWLSSDSWPCDSKAARSNRAGALVEHHSPVSATDTGHDSLAEEYFSASCVTVGDPSALHDALRQEPGCLYVKSLLAKCPNVLRTLCIDQLTFSSTQDFQLSAGARTPTRRARAPETASSHFDAGGFLAKADFASPSQRRSGPDSPSALRRELPVNEAVDSPLLLRPGSYCVFAMLAEKGAGTRAHVNAKGCHAWHILLSGRKEWIVVHPLDKHLVMDGKTGKLADLFNVDEEVFPHVRHARIYHFTQEAGELVFLPSDAVHTEITLGGGQRNGGNDGECVAVESDDRDGDSGSVSLLLYFMDASNHMSFLKHTRANATLQSSRNAESLLPEITPLTTVDLVLFDENVFPSFRGNHRRYRPEDKVGALTLRSMTEFSQIHLPCSELGARLELEALQRCFHLLGKTMLTEYDPPRYAVGVPKGYLVSASDHRLILYYFVEPFSLQQIRQCLAHHHIQQQRHCCFQYYDCPDATLPAIHLFRSTVSHQGRLPNYVPLSVLLNQAWPFESGLVRKLVNLPSIILDKAHHPSGFVRPGSVWSYSAFDIAGAPATLVAPQDSDDDTSLRRGDHDISEAAKKQQYTTEEPVEDEEGEGPASFPRAVADDEAFKDDPDSGWCSIFLFYCNPTLDKSIAAHPLRENSVAQVVTALADSLGSGCRGASSGDKKQPAAAAVRPDAPRARCQGPLTPAFSPRILEFVWNAEELEEFGMVSLLEFNAGSLSELKQKLLTDPSFERFEGFVESHGMRALHDAGEASFGVLASVVLWFMCLPGVVGFALRAAAAHGVGRGGNGEPSTAEEEDEQSQDAADAGANRGDHKAKNRHPAHPLYSPFLSDSCSYEASATLSRPSSFTASPRLDSAMPSYYSLSPNAGAFAASCRWDTVCLTAAAASKLLSYRQCSAYASMATRLCNWLCDVPTEEGPAEEQALLEDVAESLRYGDAEEQAVVFEVIKTKQKCTARKEPVALVDVPDPTHARRASSEASGFVNEAKLAKLSALCQDIERNCTGETRSPT